MQYTYETLEQALQIILPQARDNSVTIPRQLSLAAGKYFIKVVANKEEISTIELDAYEVIAQAMTELETKGYMTFGKTEKNLKSSC